ncbi:MAG: class I SAM-dependent methyltransferase [Pseudomonadales bacterium]
MAQQNDLVAGLYDRASPIYDQVGSRQFSRFGNRLVELMGIQPRASVLDVGVGRGANLFPAAKRVGPKGRVVGIDISQGMLNEVDVAIRNMALTQASVKQMDGAALDFADETFDHLLCGYTIFWFNDLSQALKGFHRVLRTDGSLGISMFGGGDPRWAWYEELLRQYGDKYVKFTSLGGNDVNGKPEVLREALRNSGFYDERILIESFEIVQTSPEGWWEEKWAHGSRAALEQMPPDIRDRFKTDAMAKLKEMEEDGVYRTKWNTCFAVARKRQPQKRE